MSKHLLNIEKLSSSYLQLNRDMSALLLRASPILHQELTLWNQHIQLQARLTLSQLKNLNNATHYPSTLRDSFNNLKYLHNNSILEHSQQLLIKV